MDHLAKLVVVSNSSLNTSNTAEHDEKVFIVRERARILVKNIRDRGSALGSSKGEIVPAVIRALGEDVGERSATTDVVAPVVACLGTGSRRVDWFSLVGTVWRESHGDSCLFGEVDVGEDDFLRQSGVDDGAAAAAGVTIVVSMVSIVMMVALAHLRSGPLRAISLLGVGRDYDSLAVVAPFVCAEVMRHVQAGEEAGGAEVRVHREEVFAQVGRSF